MIRAIFFDFYTVWTPDKLSYYLATAQLSGPQVYKEVYDLIESYYHGQIDIDKLADTLRVKLGHQDISDKLFKLSEQDISPQIVNFMRELHGHFLKLGVLANLGNQELRVLTDFNKNSQVLEYIASPLSLQVSQPLLSQEVFAKALQGIGEPINNCVLVSGNVPYLQFAQVLGMGTIQFEGFAQLKNDIDRVVASEMPT